jgi:hypothetical protein
MRFSSDATFRTKTASSYPLEITLSFWRDWGLVANDALRSSKPQPWVDTVERVSVRCKVARFRAWTNHASISIELGDRGAAAKETMCSQTVTDEENFRLPRLAKAV